MNNRRVIDEERRSGLDLDCLWIQLSQVLAYLDYIFRPGSVYFVDDEKLILNVKNVDIFLNPGQALVYDVWYTSSNYDYPIPASGLTINGNC